ncbi:hypothetical protein [Streptomyces sp. JNUCC 63]
MVQRFTEFDFGLSWVMGFFHQDWMYDGPTAADAVKKHFAEEVDQEVLAVRRDAQALVDGLPSESIEVLWTAGAQYLPGFESTTGSEWTRTVIALCDARLATTADVRPLTGADLEDGTAQEEAIVAEIGRLDFLDADVKEALAECARRCSPDLAFRVLLRVLVNASGAWLSTDQYARMEAIGSALHYGEFVVEDVRYLVAEEPPPPGEVRRFTDCDFGVTWLMREFRPDYGSSVPASPARTVRGHFVDESDPRAVLAVRRDAQFLLDYLPAHTSEVLWLAGTGLGPGFFSVDTPDTESGKVWMRTIIRECDAWLAGRDVEPLSGADLAGSRNRDGRLVDEIGKIVRRLEADVGRAITECAWLCSSELAVRLMLRALAVAGASLSPSQYAQLESWGAMFHYGGPVVADVSHLVREG